MKSILTAITCLVLMSNAAKAQNLASKIPAEANIVIKYSGANLLQKLPANKFDSYKRVKKEFFKNLGLSGKTPISSIGINFQQDAYQYVVSTDSSSFLVTLFSIKDEAKFSALIKRNYKPAKAFDTKNGYKFYAVSSSTFIGWNGNLATLINADYSSYKYYQSDYSDYNYAPAAVDTAKMFEGVGAIEPYEDSTIALVEAMAQIDTTSVAVDEITRMVDSAAAQAAADADAAMAVADTVAKYEEVKTPDEIRFTPPVISEDVEYSNVAVDSVVAAVPYQETEWQKKDRLARDKFYKDLEIYNDSVRLALSQNILTTTFKSAIISKPFSSLIDNKADISIWVDSVGFLNKLWNKMYYPYSYSRYSYNRFNVNGWPGTISGINIYFEKDSIRISQVGYAANEKGNNLLKASLDSKQSASLANYVRPKDLGYLSMSVNTENLTHYYYTVIKRLYSNMYNGKKYDAFVDAYVDILEICVDEKGVSDMITGNAVFILHGVKPRTVKYITYEYDKENYTQKEIEKTKVETSPDFTVVFETRNENIYNKLIHLPITLEDSTIKYAKTGNYYTLTMDDKDLFEKMYFMVRDGKCIITTSKEVVANPNYNLQTTADASSKESILNNNYSAKFNIKDILKDCALSVSDEGNKKMLEYLQANAGTLTIESGIKNDTIQSNTILSIAGKHKNSLEYLFNLWETLIQMDESEKE
ncbi:hypothetical protein ACQ33O_00760 [Ferruginibacter sp. SUN002]|uniref:hypothetical protein n=1 Tax=Ferruginibacter sp. SUN002 TaxID=2937789 RepID=UPI003D36B860